MRGNLKTREELMLEVADLHLRIAEAEAILQAIRNFEVDALVVKVPQGERVFTLETANYAYHQVVEQMREGAVTLTVQGLVLYANQAAADMLGQSSAPLIGQPLAQYLAAADRPRLAALLGDPDGGRLAVQFEPDKRERLPVSVSASRLLVDDQPMVLLLITDLTREREADRVARLLTLAARLSAAAAPAQVAEAVVQGAVQALGGAAGLVVVAGQDGQLDLLRTAGIAADRADAMSALIAVKEAPIWDALDRGELVVIETVEECQRRYPRWPEPADSGAVGALVAVPLVLAGRLLGGLQIRFHGPNSFGPDDRDFALTVGQACAQALDRAVLFSQMEQRVQERTAELQGANDQLAQANRLLREEVSQRREVQRQLERSREEERTRVARELHDELGAALTVLKMDISRVLREAGLPAAAGERLRGVNADIDGTIQAVRRLSSELHPQLLTDLGLLPALEAHFQEFVARAGLDGRFVAELDSMPLSGEPATACFRIFQEALTNVARHAQATCVTASVEPYEDGLLLRVTDNGIGMRLEDGVARGHLGLMGMRERAELLSARLDIVTAPGQGTTVLVRIPAPS